MKLTPIALKRIDELETRLQLALLFKVTERRVSQMIKTNKAFGPLVSPGALDIIKAYTKLREDQILDKKNLSTKAAA
jgi:hypothetical protein